MRLTLKNMEDKIRNLIEKSRGTSYERLLSEIHNIHPGLLTSYYYHEIRWNSVSSEDSIKIIELIKALNPSYDHHTLNLTFLDFRNFARKTLGLEQLQ
jgi:hypothetical protein